MSVKQDHRPAAAAGQRNRSAREAAAAAAASPARRPGGYRSSPTTTGARCSWQTSNSTRRRRRRRRRTCVFRGDDGPDGRSSRPVRLTAGTRNPRRRVTPAHSAYFFHFFFFTSPGVPLRGLAAGPIVVVLQGDDGDEPSRVELCSEDLFLYMFNIICNQKISSW